MKFFQLCFLLEILCYLFVAASIASDGSEINVRVGTIYSVSKTSVLVTWTLNTSARLISTVIGFQLQYDSKPSFDDASLSETVFDSSARSKQVNNLTPDTVYVFRVSAILSLPGQENHWSNVVAVETAGSEVKMGLVLTFGTEVQAVKQGLIKEMIKEIVESSLSTHLDIRSVEVEDVRRVLAASVQSGIQSPSVVKAYVQVVFAKYKTVPIQKMKDSISSAMSTQTALASFQNVQIFVQSDFSECNDPNKEFRDCGNECVKTCQVDQECYPTKECVAGCFCKQGYVYDPDRLICVPEASCKMKCFGKNEELMDCGLKCFESCSSSERRNCRGECTQGCFCKEGYARVNNECVPLTSCPLCNLAQNRVYKDCAFEKFCLSSLGVLVNATCKSGCFCMDGYLEYQGKCIPESECGSLCNSQPNLVFSTCGNSPCEKTCQDNSRDLCQISNDHVANSLCKAGCFCEPGFVRDLFSGLCVLRQDCPRQCMDPNETFALCDDNCLKRCDGSVYCEANTSCRVGQCVCKSGFYRLPGTRQKCEPDPKCLFTRCDDPNASYRCSVPDCEPKCSNLNSNCSSESSQFKCDWGCYCNPGYVLNFENKCIPVSECPVCFNENTLFNPCGCERTCSQGESEPCRSCVSGCFCKEGYAEYRGYCIPRSECPGNCRNDMMFSDCATCKPTCIDKMPFCRGCVPGCSCKTGSFSHDGRCLSSDECDSEMQTLPCTLADKNSTYSESIRCRPSCRDPNPPECDLRTGELMKGCMCKAGFLFNGTNCVSPVDCPLKVCPDENSEVVRCSNYCERSCQQPDENDCQGNQCDSGCLCKRGYYRNSLGVCVVKDQCRNCAANMHYEEMGCHMYCRGQSVVNSICNGTSGCFCNTGFFWHSGSCLPVSMCYKGYEMNAPQVVPVSMKRFASESVQFSCSAPASSSLVVWYHNSTRLTVGRYFSKVDAYLKVEDAQPFHSGSYQCAVYSEDAVLIASRAALLSVEASLSRIQASLNASQVTVDEDAFVAFQCNVKSDKPPTIMWRFRGGALPETDRIQVLPAANVLVVSRARLDLQGEYSCVAYHPDGESAYAAVVLRVIPKSPVVEVSLESSVNVNEGNNGNNNDNNPNVSVAMDSGSYIGMEGKPIQLKCLVWGVDPSLVSWRRSNSTINELFAKVSTEQFNDYAVSILLFSRLRRSDAGVYSCSVPRFPSVTPKTTYLLVERSKTWFNLQIFPTGSNGVLNVERGQNLTLACQVTNGTATPTIDWYYNNSVRLPSFLEVTLNKLVHVNVQFSGHYMCCGSHGNEQQFQSIFVNVTSSGKESEDSFDYREINNNDNNPAGTVEEPKVVVEIWETSPFNYNITCSIKNGGNQQQNLEQLGIESLTWLFNDSYNFPRNVYPAGPEMLLLNSARLDNAGLFTCVVTTRDGAKMSGSAQLSFLADPNLPEVAPYVSVSPSSVVAERADQIIRLFCVIKSRTDPVKINWVEKSTQSSKGSSALLQIEASELKQRLETYTCFASNFFGTNSQSTTVEKTF